MKAKTVLWIIGTPLLLLTFGVVGLDAWGSYKSREVRRWDARIDALCAADGGINVATRVYERVLAPETKEYFSETKPVRSLAVPSRRDGMLLGPAYPYVSETRVLEVLNREDPSVIKYTERIVRVSDSMVLAERFGYQRSGGGIPGFDPGEIRSCPSMETKDRLDVLVFINHPRNTIVSSK